MLNYEVVYGRIDAISRDANLLYELYSLLDELDLSAAYFN
jgi:hypothetical protein